MEAAHVEETQSIRPALDPASTAAEVEGWQFRTRANEVDAEEAPHASESTLLETEATVAEPYADPSALPTVGQLSASNVTCSAAATAATTIGTYQTGVYSNPIVVYQQPQTATFLSPDGCYPPAGDAVPALHPWQQSYQVQSYGQNNMSVGSYAVGADGAYYAGGMGQNGMMAAPTVLPNGQIPMYFNPSNCGYDQSSCGKDPRKGYPLVYPYVPLMKEKREKPLKKRTGCC
eukprot:GHVS01028527.1.p1 GENE.GHVS01028527.1~~GHVS01028527.1.p1  ORF type:complete len:232 (+),score=30.77 GHVS01028527.1:50-745(+)